MRGFHDVDFDAVASGVRHVLIGHARALIGHQPKRRPHAFAGRRDAADLIISVRCAESLIIFRFGSVSAVDCRFHPRRVPACAVLSVRFVMRADGQRAVAYEQRIFRRLVIAGAANMLGRREIVTCAPFGRIQFVSVEFVRPNQIVIGDCRRERFFLRQIAHVRHACRKATCQQRQREQG